MAVHLSGNAQVEVAAGALGQLIGASIDQNDTQVDITNWDSTFREYVNAGLIDGDVSFEVQYDLADTGQDSIRAGLGSTEVAVVFYPEGNTTGKPSLTFNAIFGTDGTVFGAAEDVITATYTGKLTSVITEGTVSA